jgi:hypothetical protein
LGVYYKNSVSRSERPEEDESFRRWKMAKNNSNLLYSYRKLRFLEKSSYSS